MPSTQNKIVNNVDPTSTSHQYSSHSRAGVTNSNTNGGSQRNISPYQQHSQQQQQQQQYHNPSHQQQSTQQQQHHHHHHHQQQHNRRTPSQPTTGGTMIHAGGDSMMTGNTIINQGNMNSNNIIGNNTGPSGMGNPRMSSSATALPTPMFERLVTEEVQELKAYARIIENQNRRLVELERVHGDLEARLELEARGRAQLEATLEARERDWSVRYRQMEMDRDHWKEEVTKEQSKNARLIDQVVRKDQDIHRMLQRKYDNQREPLSTSVRNSRQLNNDTPPRQTQDLHVGHNSTSNIKAIQQQLKSPHEIIAESGSMETVRIRNVKNLLTDFFGGV